MATEKRLIDADALLDRFSELASKYKPEGDLFFLDAIADEIMDAPTVDAVEVVRCKDCKWCRYSKVHDVQWCDHESGLCDAIVGNEYCSYGERRTDE